MSAKNAVVYDMEKPKFNQKSKLEKLEEMRIACEIKRNLANNVANRIEHANIDKAYKLERKFGQDQEQLSSTFTKFVHRLVVATNKKKMKINVRKKRLTPEYIGMKAAVLKLVKLYEE